jgi:hypothetical protein
MRGLKADATEADIEVLITIKEDHGYGNEEAQDIADHLASETMKVIATAPGIRCPLSKIKVGGR